MNLATWLQRTAVRDPAAPALFMGEAQVADYGAWADRAARIAAGLRTTAGLAAGERVGLFASNSPAYLEALFAILWAGLAAVPINAKLHAREAQFILEDCGAALCFVDGEHARALGAAPPGCEVVDFASARFVELGATAAMPLAQVPSDALAWLFYTSGTTGRPKGVMISHGNLATMTCCYFADVDTVSRADAIVYAAPISHGAGLYSFPHVLRGARHVVPESGGFDPPEILALAARHRNVSMFAAPTMVRRLVEHVESCGASCDGIRTIVYGGGPMYVADILHAIDVVGQRFVQIYGQGESPMTITALARADLADTAHPDYLARLASVGVAQSAVEVAVVDAGGRPLPAGEVGEIVVRGPSVMLGYWRNPEATASAIRDGWLFTGDMGVLDAHGYLTLKDRSKDMIISGGSNIYPREVEEVLLLHPEVAEASVIGLPDAEWGEVVVAVIASRGARAPSPDELDALCLEHIARFKRPRRYEFVRALPKNNYGKVLKTELRERFG
ncbi:MAG TPA: AMP-binding protein [Burkholderiaceae bacterium]